MSPSPFPSAPNAFQVPGTNCIGPTARSHVVFPSYTPWSVSAIAAIPGPPSRTGPRILPRVLPFASTLPPLACPDSTLPIPASSGHVM
ncbi:hypothetical protein E0H45_38450 [Kribbella soli]|uniref:Uncharacterized protein n=1 Tax=Kribbella soli TaxID=1124743 RepID=A0A4V2LY36_9ACTN|nr:hypothetical protein E0H45_38450 [Kribbella soli]